MTVAEGSYLISPSPRPSAATRLFCLPPAGSGASAFRGWPAALPSTVDVSLVALPGRERRLAEPPVIDIPAVAAAIRAAADRPFACYGHSLGGLIAYEVIRELRRTGGPLPTRLIVGAARAPHVPDPLTALALEPDKEFLDAVVDLGGMPAEILAEPELVRLFLPALRCDFVWYHEYRHVPDEPLPIPLTAVSGDRDTIAKPDHLAGWRDYTSAEFAFRSISGGHFFFAEELAATTELVAAELAPAAVGQG